MKKAIQEDDRVSTEESRTPSLEEAYRLHARYIAGVSRRILGPGADADDLVQDVFLEASKGLNKLRSEKALRSWLVKLTVRMASRRLRRKKLFRWLHLEEESSHSVECFVIDAEKKNDVLRLYRILGEIAAPERLAWTLRHIEGYRLEELCALCECSLATAKRRISAADKKIRKEMSE